MTELGKPTVARVNGHALAGGFGLVAACDLAIAVSEAQFGMPEVNVGVFPMMIMAIVFRNLPRKAAMELMLTGKRIDAAEAARLGLINRHVAGDRLDAEVDALAAELARKSPIGMKLGLEAFYKMQDMSFPSAIAYLQDQLALLDSRADDPAIGRLGRGRPPRRAAKLAERGRDAGEGRPGHRSARMRLSARRSHLDGSPQVGPPTRRC